MKLRRQQVRKLICEELSRLLSEQRRGHYFAISEIVGEFLSYLFEEGWHRDHGSKPVWNSFEQDMTYFIEKWGRHVGFTLDQLRQALVDENLAIVDSRTGKISWIDYNTISTYIHTYASWPE